MATKEMIAVMTAYEEGKEIETRLLSETKWDKCPSPTWNWQKYEYRIYDEQKNQDKEEIQEFIQDIVGIKARYIEEYKDCYYAVFKSGVTFDQINKLNSGKYGIQFLFSEENCMGVMFKKKEQ